MYLQRGISNCIFGNRDGADGGDAWGTEWDWRDKCDALFAAHWLDAPPPPASIRQERNLRIKNPYLHLQRAVRSKIESSILICISLPFIPIQKPLLKKEKGLCFTMYCLLLESDSLSAYSLSGKYYTLNAESPIWRSRCHALLPNTTALDRLPRPNTHPHSAG